MNDAADPGESQDAAQVNVHGAAGCDETGLAEDGHGLDALFQEEYKAQPQLSSLLQFELGYRSVLALRHRLKPGHS